MENKLNIKIAQLNQMVGDVKNNIAKILNIYEQSKESDLIITPELSITGYPLEDLVEDKNFAKFIESEFEKLVPQIGETALIVGKPTYENGEIFNSAVVIQNGKIIHRVDKRHLPNYGVFDEKRNFKHGRLPSVPFKLKGQKIGLMICEDCWFEDVARDLKNNGSEIAIAVNASPFRDGIMQTRINQVVKKRAIENDMPIIYVNQVGGQDELVFDGGSFAVDKSGNRIFQLDTWMEQVATLKPENIGEYKGDKLSDIWNATVLGTKDYVRKTGFSDIVLGLSGGIDSAVVMAIAIDALGAEHVHPIALPSRYTSDLSNNLAQQMCDIYKIKMETIAIEPIFRAMQDSVKYKKGLTEENIQARIRGNILMALSNDNNWMLLSTGNKSEMAVGYATLYGDMSGGFNPLKDIYKTLVFELAKWRNKNGIVIPNEIINRPPSAELKPDQADTDSLPPYPVLDGILENIVEKQIPIDKIPFDSATVKKVYAMLQRAEYKRRQSAPGIKITDRALRSNDRRVPIVNSFNINNQRG